MYMTPSGSFRLPHPASAARTIKMGVKQHFTGSFVIGEDEGHEIEFESHLEFTVGLVMLALRDVVALENQALFRWVDKDGKPVRHFFDYRLALKDGTRVALIVKKSKKAAEAEFRASMRLLARQVPPSFANRVTLITEKDLDPVDVHNAGLIHGVRLPDPVPDAAVRRVVAMITGAARISDIVAAAGFSGSGFGAVLRLIRANHLDLVNHERIAPDALVRRRVS